jgi:hypothetical protein
VFSAISKDLALLCGLKGHPHIFGTSLTPKGSLSSYLSKLTLALHGMDEKGSPVVVERDVVVQIIGGMSLFGLDSIANFDMSIMSNQRKYSLGTLPPPFSLLSWDTLMKRAGVTEADLQPISQLPPLNPTPPPGIDLGTS